MYFLSDGGNTDRKKRQTDKPKINLNKLVIFAITVNRVFSPSSFKITTKDLKPFLFPLDHQGK